MKNRICKRCKKAPTKTKHFNCKYCDACRVLLLKRPRGGLTKEQKLRAEELRGKMSREEIAEELGVSVAALKRSFRGQEPFWFSNGKLIRNPTLTKQVADFYSEHGMPATIKRFPNVRVKSIIYRYHPVKQRQARWKPEQLIELVRMAGLVSFEEQAKIFKRPRAFEGSIKSVWVKRFRLAPGEIHGMKRNQAKHLVTPKAPYIKTYGDQYLCLWVDIKKHLNPEVPDFISSAIEAMAAFQEWIFGGNARQKILALHRRFP